MKEQADLYLVYHLHPQVARAALVGLGIVLVTAGLMVVVVVHCFPLSVKLALAAGW